MPLSRKELRRISKALRRSEGGTNISNTPSGFSPAKDSTENVMPAVPAPTEDRAYQLKVIKGRQHATIRSVSEAVTKLEIQEQSVASKKGDGISDGVATVTLVTPRRRLPADRCLDPSYEADRLPKLKDNDAISKLTITSSELEASVEDKLDEASASSTSSSSISANDQSKPRISDFWRSTSANSSGQPRNAFLEKLRSSKPPPTLSKNDFMQGEEVQKTLLAQQATPVRIERTHACLQAGPNAIPSTHTEHPDAQPETRLLESLDGTNERPSQNLLINYNSKEIDQGLRIKRWVEQAPPHGSEEEHASLSERLAARSGGFSSSPTPPVLPSIANSVQVRASDCLDSASEVQSETTTLLDDLRPNDEVWADRGHPITSPSDSGRMSQNFLIHPHGPPWGYHPRIEYNWFNSQAACRAGRDTTLPGRMQLSRQGAHRDITEAQRRQHNPITIPMTNSQRHGEPPSSSAHRYKPTCYGASMEVSRQLRYPDWTQDARRRPAIPKRQKEDVRTSMMNGYTKKYYGGHLDAARKLDHMEIPKKEFDLGGLLP
ncbi:MAG: hypothetical protein L6R41_000875 [Letrouitia leprolyta]|nr:MAG: hypothetical protein L6R41_000875 [Letrouitia leprolyta]